MGLLEALLRNTYTPIEWEGGAGSGHRPELVASPLLSVPGFWITQRLLRQIGCSLRIAVV